MNEVGAQVQITTLLKEIEAGDSSAVDMLLPRLYDELRVLAHAQLRRERPGHTLATTALVHEAYLKLVQQDSVNWKNRAHFLGVAALAMRRILINYANARLAEKRGGGRPVVTLEEEEIGRPVRAEELVALDEALERLARIDERQSNIVVYRFFGGLKQEEIAEVLGVSVPTVRRDWRLARAWLSREVREMLEG